MQKHEPSLTSMRQMVLEIFHFKVRDLSKMDVTILYSFSLISFNYDITDAILQDIEKMRVQHLRSFFFDSFEILQAVRIKQRNFT